MKKNDRVKALTLAGFKGTVLQINCQNIPSTLDGLVASFEACPEVATQIKLTYTRRDTPERAKSRVTNCPVS